MAIEDAIALARTLRDQPAVDQALRSYEERRRERVEKTVAWGARGSSQNTPGSLGRLTRDLMLPLLFKYVVTEKSTSWIYDYRPSLAEPIHR